MGSAQLGRPPRGGCNATAACLAGAVLAAALAPHPAGAQAQEHAFARIEVVDSSTLQNDADMDFGDIIPGASAGTVVLTPSASATCTASSSLVRSGPCKAAQFSGTAFAGANLRVRRPMPNSITLTGPAGATMTVTTFTLGSTAPTVYLGSPGNSPNHRFEVNAADGSYTFHVGGTLNVGANQFPGIYNGTFDIEVSYN